MTDRAIVASFDYDHEAQLSISTLRDAGLDARIANPNAVSMDSTLTFASGGVAVDVPVDELDAAKRVLGGQAGKQITFRDRVRTGTLRMLLVGFFALLAGSIFGGSLPRAWLAVAMAIPIIAAWWMRGYEARCSLTRCHERIGDELKCPGCGAYVVGDLRPGENHLAAEERWFEARGSE